MIPAPEIPEVQSWANAPYVVFAIVHSQLAVSEHRFYAFGGGNDLGGMILRPADAEAAREAVPRKEALLSHLRTAVVWGISLMRHAAK